MAWRELTPPSSPDARQRVQMDGRTYGLRWRWLQLPSRWALDVSASDGALLAGGITVVPNIELFGAVRGARPEFPPGDLTIVDPRRTPGPITQTSIGGPTARIIYREAST